MSAVRFTPELMTAAEPGGPEVELILSAMDAARPAPALRLVGSFTANLPAVGAGADRRRSRRLDHRVRAELTLFADAPGTPPWVLFTRDVDPKGVGFITRHPVPLGYGGWLELLAPDGQTLRATVTTFRCREAVNGWYEGALHFNKRQGRMG